MDQLPPDQKQYSQSINRVWGSQGINILVGGYLSYHNGPKSGHRLLCFRIFHTMAFVDKNLPLNTPSTRKLSLRYLLRQKNIYLMNALYLQEPLMFTPTEMPGSEEIILTVHTINL